MTQWITEQSVQVRTDVFDDLGHFNTLDEVNQEAEKLWGAIERGEEEGSIPWYHVYRCQSGLKGYHLVTVGVHFDKTCDRQYVAKTLRYGDK